MGPFKESLSLLYKSFLQSLLTYDSPGWFPFLSVTNFTKLERLHRAASCAITGCLSSSPIPLLLSEASLPPLRVALTHFTLLSYERALHLPTSFPISGLAKLGVRPRLCRSSWRAFASTSTRVKVRLSPTLTLSSLMIWYSGLTTLFLFLLARATLAYLPTALSVALRPLFPVEQAQYVQVFPLKPAPFCTLFAGLGNTNKSATSILFFYLTLVLSSPP